MRGRMPRQEYEVHGGSWPRCEDCEGCAADGRLPCGPGSAANNAGKMLGGGRRLSHPPSGDEVHHHLGVSGFATYAVVDAASAVVVGDDVPADVAAVLGCAVLTGGGAVLNAAKPGPGDPVMVVGLGGVEMAALITAEARTVIGSYSGRRYRAATSPSMRRCGARAGCRSSISSPRGFGSPTSTPRWTSSPTGP